MPPRWTGLKGKPESADTAALFRKHGHRFPGPGYGAHADLCVREQLGYQRLIRTKINELFSAPDDVDAAALQAAQGAGAGGSTARSSSSTFGRVAAAENDFRVTARNVGALPGLHQPMSTTSIAGRPASAQRSASATAAVSTTAPYNRLLPARPDSQAGRYRTLVVSADGLAHLEPAKMAGLTQMNRQRLASIWPQVAEGWSAPEVQDTLRSVGRDVEESPLRTMTGRGSAPPQQQQQRSAAVAAAAAAGGAFNNKSGTIAEPSASDQSGSARREAPAAGPFQTHSSPSTLAIASAYNRRIRAPAIPQPFLGKRGTAQQREAENTTVLLRKLADLEHEIRTQQGNKAEMQQHVAELRAILLTGGSASASQQRESEQLYADGRDPTASAEAISSSRNRYFPPGAREMRNVRFAN